MSAATMRGSGSAGYSSISTSTPMAPAPTDVSVTKAPITAPSNTGRPRCVGLAAARSAAASTERGAAFPATTLYSVATAVSSSAAPRVVVIACCTTGLAGPNRCSTYSVSSEAGMLPAAIEPTMRQSITLERARAKEPPILVKAANSKSVPIAKCGLRPKKKISSGVMSEPPPTPVSPTTRPTEKPAKTKANSCMAATV